MSYARIQHSGNAIPTTLNGAITSGATSLSLALSTGWPDGSVGPFYLCIDEGLATEEHILATSRTTTTLNSLTRGVDGTAAAAHASGAAVTHIFTAVEADEANVAVTKTLGQVTTKGDGLFASASQTIARVAAGANNTVLHADSTATAGVSYSKIVAADITAATITSSELASNSVTTAKITDANVTTAKLATGAVTSATIADGTIVTADIASAAITLPLFGAGLQPVQVCTSATRPGTPTVGMVIYETDTGKTLYYHGAVTQWQPNWNVAWGVQGTPKNITAAQGSITSIVDVTGAASYVYTAVVNRQYRHTVNAVVSNSSAGGAVTILICDGGNAELYRGSTHVNGASSFDTLSFTWTESPGTAGSKTRKLRVSAGTGNGALQNDVSTSGSAPLQWSIEDFGPNGLPS